MTIPGRVPLRIGIDQGGADLPPFRNALRWSIHSAKTLLFDTAAVNRSQAWGGRFLIAGRETREVQGEAGERLSQRRDPQGGVLDPIARQFRYSGCIAVTLATSFAAPPLAGFSSASDLDAMTLEAFSA